MEGMEESVWSVVRQGNEREDQGKVFTTVVRPAHNVHGRDMGIEEGTGK